MQVDNNYECASVFAKARRLINEHPHWIQAEDLEGRARMRCVREHGSRLLLTHCLQVTECEVKACSSLDRLRSAPCGTLRSPCSNLTAVFLISSSQRSQPSLLRSVAGAILSCALLKCCFLGHSLP